MKKNIFLVVLFMLNCLNNFAQTTDDVFNKNIEVTWLGIDYSQTKFIGPATGWGEISTKSSLEMKDKYFPDWNRLVENEPNNFKIAEAIGRLKVNYFTKVADDANEKTKKKEIFSETISDYQLLELDDIKKMVKQYNYHGKTGIGMILIAEGMSKGREEASYWVTFVDMSSKKLLFTKQVVGKASGIGFRNYWAGSIKSVLKLMKKEFKKWD